MIPRLTADLVRARLQDYPAAGLIGPRQTGKTTLAQAFDRFNAAADLAGANRRLLVAHVKQTVFNGERGIASLPEALRLLEKEIV